MGNYRFRALVDIDVKNADSESEAREKAFGIMSGANATPARGRTPSGPKASVTGVTVEAVRDISQSFADHFPLVKDYADIRAEKSLTTNITE